MHAKNSSILALVLAALLLLAGGCAGGGGTTPGELTVMTYNIHHGEGMDKRLDLPRVARVIRDARPDLVALQEVDAGTNRTNGVMQAKELARLLGMHHAYGPAMDYDGGRYGNAVLSRHEIVEQRVIELPYKPGERREPRCALATIVHLAGGREVAFISTHLDHTARDSDRLDQAKKINQRFDDLRPPAILAGDFNCEPGSEPMEELTKTWTLASDPDALTAPADGPRTNIDHVLVKPKNRFRLVSAQVVDEPAASDHRPVVVKLELLP